MSDDMLYWFWIIAPFVVTIAAAYFIMKKTKKFGFSYGISTLINVLITAAGVFWLLSGELDNTTNFKLVVYGVSFLNLLIISAFVLLSMKNKGDAPVPESAYKE